MSDKNFRPDFIIIPYQVAFDKNLQPLDQKLYGIIFWLEHLKEGKCIASNSYLADMCNSTASSMQNSLDRLERAGVIKRMFSDKERKKRTGIKTKISFKVSLDSDRGITKQAYDVSLDSDHINKSNKGIKDITAKQSFATNDLILLFKEINPSYERFYKITTQRDAIERLVKKFGEQKVRAMIEALPSVIYQKYAPKITSPLELERDLGKLIAFYKQEKSGDKKLTPII